MAGLGGAARHPIGVVARLTGLTRDAVRVWEKRYGVVEPARTEGGHRLYTDAQVRRLSLLKGAVDAGHRIGRIAELTEAELEELGGRAEEVDGNGAASSVGGRRYLESAQGAVRALDELGVEGALRRALVALTPAGFMEGVLAPFLEWVGEAWEEGEITPAHEHAASAAARSVLGWLLEAAQAEAGAPRLVAGTLSGERHEFGAMLAAATAAVVGWSVVYLGPDLPATDLGGAARQAGARVVAVSVVNEEASSSVSSELRALASELENGTHLVVGGRGSAVYAGALAEVGAMRLQDLGALRNTLNVLASAGDE